MPKQLIPVANRPVLEYAIESVRDLGAREIVVVVGDHGEEISAAIGDGSRYGVPVTYLRQDRPRGLAHAVQVARPLLGDDDFVMYLGDNVLPEGVSEIAADFCDRRPDAELVLHKVADPRAYGVAELNPDGSVRRLEEKPPHPHSDLAIVGVYFFTAAIHRAADAIMPSARGELEITDAVSWLLASGSKVVAREYTGFWKDVGNPDDVLACNRRLLAGQRRAIGGAVDQASDIRGPVVVEPGARVLRSRIDGPAIIGAGTVVADSWVGPSASVGRHCEVRGTRLADSVVLDGASIHDAGPLHGSLIGRHAIVSAREMDESGHRVLIGDHARLAIKRA
jgi:glucose-1-phosphate thymidylyltransferase